MRQAGEPSVEEILESIKKVIARDNRVVAAEERRERQERGVAELADSADEEEVLELDAEAVSDAEVLTSMIGFTVLYGILAVVEVGLILKYARLGLPAEVPPVEIKGEDDVLSFAY